MSVVEQGPMSNQDAEVGLPEFPVALRGYDRQQVDAFLKDLSIRVTAERRRAEQAERAAAQMRAELAGLRNQPPPSFEHLGAEAGRVLEQAREAAERTHEKAMSEQLTMQAETERLRESRDRMLEYLGRIHADLGELLAEAVQADVEMGSRFNGTASRNGDG